MPASNGKRLKKRFLLETRGNDEPRGVLPEKFGRGLRPASQNAYPIYDQNLWFFPTLFTTWPKIWYPIYDLTLTSLGEVI